MRAPTRLARSHLQSAAAGGGRLLWHLIRLPALAVLLALEPLASFVLTAAGVLGIAAALILEFSGNLPGFPFWGMIALSVGALLLITAYRALVGILAR
jgi:peptidoglycan/LPS O-acetylase OafA/YrhL